MKETYTCPNCSNKFGDKDEDDNIWFIKNSGYITLGCCPMCETPEQSVMLAKIWKDYTTKLFGAKNA